MLSAETDDETEFNELNESLELQQRVFDALVDTRSQDIAYNVAMSETKYFIRVFFKLLGKDQGKYTAADWGKLNAMLNVNPNLIWQRVFRDTKSAHKNFEESFSPLHCAAVVGHEALIQRLLECSGATITIVDKYGRQPLHVAAYYGHADMCKFLYEQIYEMSGKHPVGENAPLDIVGWTPAVYSVRGRKAHNLALYNKEIHGSEEDIKQRISDAEKERDTLKRNGKKTRQVREKIEGLEKDLLSAKFGRCKDLLYAHGDHHISPKRKHKGDASLHQLSALHFPAAAAYTESSCKSEDKRSMQSEFCNRATILSATGRFDFHCKREE